MTLRTWRRRYDRHIIAHPHGVRELRKEGLSDAAMLALRQLADYYVSSVFVEVIWLQPR